MRQTPRTSYDEPSSLELLVSEPHHPLGHVLLQNMPAFMALGVEDPIRQKLGKGSFGTAFEVDLHGKSVLKLTRDPSEIQAAFLLRGKPSEHVVRVYGAWSIESTLLPGLREWYAIHRAYLTPLSKRDALLVDAIFNLYEDTSLDLVIPTKVRNHGIIDKWRVYLRQELQATVVEISADDEGFPTSSLAGKRNLARALELLKTIGRGVNEMYRAGIDWEDIHSDNIMRDENGTLVIADIGWGEMHDDFSQEILGLNAGDATRYAAESGQFRQTAQNG